MYPEIERILTRYGYQQIQLNIVGISLSVKQIGEKSHVVVTVDETTGRVFSREQFVHISEQIREFLKRRESYQNLFLYLLISEDDSSANRLFCNFENYWRIIPTRWQLLVYETGGREFDELRMPLEEIFPGMENSFHRKRTFPFGNGKMPVVNLSLVLLNVILFFITDFFVLQNNSIVEWGALNWYQVFGQGEWYRIFTSMFLHDGVQHIFNNMLVLLYIGSIVEQQIGGVRYGILYLGAGVLAGFTSMVYNMNLNENVYSLGASGAIFGIMGALLFLVLFKRKYSGGYNVRQIVIMVLFSLYGGFASQGVDNAAHLGGFIAGFLFAFLLSFGMGKRLSY